MRTALLVLAGLGATATVGNRQDRLDFRYDILPLLHRQGCGSAYCHGSATGRGGFKLSLFASDPAADHAAITRDLGGRRLDRVDPANSLLLQKPAMRLPHGGGRRLQTGGPAHRAIEAWVRAGAPYRDGPPRELVRLDLERDGDRLRVFAGFRDEDGTTRQEVTDRATFHSSDEGVAAVDAEGQVRVQGRGEAWLFARYDTLSARVPVVRPFATETKPTTPATHELDRVWSRRLAQLGLEPAPPAPPLALVRRLYLDLAARLPTPAEIVAWQQGDPRERVEATALSLMATPAFAAKFGRHLAEWLEFPAEEAERPDPRTPMLAAQRQQLVAAVARGDRLHDLAEHLLVTDRRLLDRLADPRDRAELAGRAFLGIRIGCARCHNSPVDRWEQSDHLAFSALFASSRPIPGGGTGPGILFHPELGTPVTPRVLPLATTPKPVPASTGATSHARQLADFILRGGHGRFERNLANRVFAALMGRGLCEPLDDQRPSNPAVHEPLLDHLATRAESGDLRALVLHIVTSHLYQTGSHPGDGATDQAAVRYFARREARTMAPATFASAVRGALATPPGAGLTRSPLARQLALLNGPFLADAVERSPALRELADGETDPGTQLRELFLLLLGRPPRPEETTALQPALAAGGDSGGVRDLAFALLASREFGSIR